MDTASLSPSRKKLLRGWSILAAASLALAGLFAILLVLSRMPVVGEAVPWPNEFFQKGLVAHVVLSFAVWFLAVFGGMAQIYQKHADSIIDKLGLGLASFGTLLLLIPALMDRGEPTLNNYIPVIIDPLYYAGLILLALGVLLAIYPLIRTGHQLRGATTLYVAALVAFCFALLQLGGQTPSHDFNESLFWGGGHILQFVNVALMLAAWYLLGDAALNRPLVGDGLYRLAIILLTLSGLAALSFYFLWDREDTAQVKAFTDLQYALGPPVVIFGLAALPRLKALFLNSLWRQPAGLSLLSSIVVFAAGGVLGFFVDGLDTRTPAHYHGVIGGINLAFVGIFYVVFLPLLGQPVKAGRLIFSQILLYAVGQFLFIVGMFMAGGMGAARKTMDSGVDTGSSIGVLAAGIRDFGGGLAIIGGVMFIVIALKALLRKPDSRQ